MAASAGRRSRRLKASRRSERPVCLPNGEGSESDPRQSRKGSNAGPPASDLEPGREELIDEAIARFSGRYGRAVTREEARQILARLNAFFSLLVEWDQRKGARLDRAA